jgi:hypothetical protein
VALAGENPAEMVRPAARLHRDHAGRKLGRQADQRLAPHPPAQDDRSRDIQPDDAADVLAEIDAEDRNGHGSLLLHGMRPRR